jgi:hypothetical protein
LIVYLFIHTYIKSFEEPSLKVSFPRRVSL